MSKSVSYKSNIKIDKVDYKLHKINYKNTKFEKLFKDNNNLIPDFEHSTLTFNIYNTKSSFVNALRRCIIDEVSVKSLYFDLTDISTDDNFVLSDLIQKRIETIKILQSINTDITFNLNVYNNTTKIMSITTDLIQNVNTKDNTIYFNKNIKICDLKPNKFININNIHIKQEYGYNNSIYSIGKASYKVINTNMDKVQTLSTDASEFTFYIYSNGNIQTKDILFITIDTLKKRLENINNLITNYNNDKINDELIINQTNNLTLYKIKNEYHTLGNLLKDYMFDLDISTKLLNYNNDHPSKNEITIKTDNPDSDKLIINAINNILEDLKNLYNVFKK